ncbi:MAG: hypothetical protein QOK35_908, partial [Pseudonocardiales bacterium]|nr:hypothetical protein [Pseudonocardiales bacterium]
MTALHAHRPASSAARKVRARRVGFRFDHEVARHYV